MTKSQKMWFSIWQKKRYCYNDWQA